MTLSESEVIGVLKGRPESASGPDGIQLPQLKACLPETLARWMNIFLYCGRLPRVLNRGRVTLIPKVKEPVNASEYRPITVYSHVARIFHKLIAKRLASLRMSWRQKGFRNMDGCAEHVATIKALLRRARAQRKDTYLVFIDVKRAFPSVSHGSLIAAARRAGIPVSHWHR